MNNNQTIETGETPHKPACTTCDDTGIAVYPLRLCGDCDAGKEKWSGSKPVRSAINQELLILSANIDGTTEAAGEAT